MKIHKKVIGGITGLFAVAALLNIVALIGFLPNVSAVELSPQLGYEWIDKGTIEVQFSSTTNKKNVRFIDSAPNDKTLNYTYTDSCGVNTIRITELNKKGKSYADASYWLGSKAKNNCEKIEIKQSEGDLPFEIKKYSNYSKAPSTGVSSVNPSSPTAFPVATATPAPAAAAPSATATGSNVECGGNPLSWISCALIDELTQAVDGIFDNIIKPLLTVEPLSLDPTSKTFQVWSSFRILGNIFLVIGLLIIVFGQSIGGGLIDAYTAKKSLPRLLAAAILINISYYLVAFAVDVTNVVGSGIAGLIEQPFNDNGAYKIDLGTTSSTLTTAGLVGGSVYLWFAIGPFMQFIAVFFLVPALLTMLAILCVVMIRLGLIVLLVMVSPVAFALYCLPNTEQYFKKWWDLLLRTLMVYPIIAVLFAIANVLSVSIQLAASSSGGNFIGRGLTGAVADFVSVIALFVPLFAIPFAFQLAGGIIGKIGDVANGMGKRGSEAFKGNVNDPNSRRNRARYNLDDRNTQLRERAVRNGQREGAGFASRRFGRAMNYGNLQAKRSMYNEQQGKMLAGQVATGDDSNQRDLFTEYDKSYTYKDDNGKTHQGAWFRRMDMQKDPETGELRGIPGASPTYKGENAFQRGNIAKRKAQSLYGGNQSAVQEALYYEWKKTAFNPDQMNNIASQFGAIKKENGFDDAELGGMMKGVGFRHQGSSLASKHSSFKEKKVGGKGTGEFEWKVDHIALAKEGSRNIGTYAWSNQDEVSFKELSKAYTSTNQALVQSAGKPDTAVLSGLTGDAKEYEGKTRAQVMEANMNLQEMAKVLNPDQGQNRSGKPEIGKLETVIDGTPQVSGMGGISGAPVVVQQAARNFYNTVYGGRP